MVVFYTESNFFSRCSFMVAYLRLSMYRMVVISMWRHSRVLRLSPLLLVCLFGRKTNLSTALLLLCIRWSFVLLSDSEWCIFLLCLCSLELWTYSLICRCRTLVEIYIFIFDLSLKQKKKIIIQNINESKFMHPKSFFLLQIPVVCKMHNIV